jgi:hypothetical protein
MGNMGGNIITEDYPPTLQVQSSIRLVLPIVENLKVRVWGKSVQPFLSKIYCS